MPNPGDMWNAKIKTDGMSSQDFIDLLNDEAKKGNVDVVLKDCTDGEFAFFGNYKK